MPSHEHFEELCALAQVGQLSTDEYRDLQRHLKICEGCSRVAGDFAQILSQLPVTVSRSDSKTDELRRKCSRRLFFRNAAAAGIRFTPEAIKGPGRRPFGFRFFRRVCDTRTYVIPLALSAAAGVATLLYFSAPTRLEKEETINNSRLASEGSATITSTNHDERREQNAFALAGSVNGSGDPHLESLKQELATAHAEESRLERQSDELKQKIVALKLQSRKTEQALSDADAGMERLRMENAETLAGLVAKENRIQELSNTISSQAAALERERQLNVAARDVRQFMGARNLHVIDVYDYSGQSDTEAKTFGRVLYTEGKSLIFYAFDLPQRVSGTNLVFQGWGERKGQPVARRLGVFQVDDRQQKRWVMRVDDPKLLGSIDWLFVTVEASPGQDVPSGDRFLYANLATKANHP
jgi:hypothetical protein